jgi:hypothetical protein
MTSAVCTFEARLDPGCVCAVALRRAADGTGGGVLFPSASPGLNAFACAPETKLLPSDVSGTDGARADAATTTDMRLEDLTLCLECPPESGCVPSRPVDLARALVASSPADGSPRVLATAPRRARRVETTASRETRGEGVARDAPRGRVAKAGRRASSPTAPPRSTDTDATRAANGHDETLRKTKTKTGRFFSVACASAAKAAVSVAAALAFFAAAPR